MSPPSTITPVGTKNSQNDANFLNFAISGLSRLGKHHFAHLKAVALGVPFQASALRYLGIHHGHQGITAHRRTVDAVRALARRHSEPAWRLIGLLIRVDLEQPQAPSIAEFAAERGLEDWSEEDVQQFYIEAYPEQAASAKSAKAKRRERLRRAQLELLERLEKLSVVPATPLDLVSTWFDPATSQRLINAGMVTLQDMADRIAVGGRWFGGMPGVGVKKAQRMEAFLQELLGELPSRRRAFDISTSANSFRATGQPGAIQTTEGLPLELTHQASHGLDVGILGAQNDADAITEWVEVKAGSQQTAKAYRREATRLLLWLREFASGKVFADMTPSDCKRYMDFLSAIPKHWQSRARATPGTEGWAPFRGAQLDLKSRQYAINVLASFFAWLHAAQYIPSNPWLLVNRKLGDDPGVRILDTKALSEGTMTEILRVIHEQPPSPSRDRILFILSFVEAMGLRSQELISARLQDFSLESEGWVLHVHGKGAKNRVAIVPGQAMAAVQTYLQARGLEGIESAPGNYPLLASISNTAQPIGYQALYEHVKAWLKKAIAASVLPEHERRKLNGVSTHWLRHTFGTRAVSREVPFDVIQDQLGHASIQTTMNIYGRAPIKRRSTELGKAFRSPIAADT